MKRLCLLFAATLLILGVHHGNASDDHGITQQVHGPSEFTFRNGRLVYELSRMGENWSEIFYDGTAEVFTRAGIFKDGQPVVTSEHYKGKGAVHLLSMLGDHYPRRITAGGEIYNRTKEGFFKIMPDPSVTHRESVIMGAVFSTKETMALRERFLAPRPPSEEKEAKE